MYIDLAISNLFSNNNNVKGNEKQEFFAWCQLIKNNIDLKSKNLKGMFCQIYNA